MTIELYHIDCMDYMATQPDKAFDLAIVDPPYGIGDFLMRTGGGAKPGIIKDTYKGRDCTWNSAIPDSDYFSELARTSKERIIWGANYYNCFSEKGGALVWYKNMGHKNLSDCEIASVSFQKKVDYVYIQSLRGFVANEIRIHPCQKPVKLYEWLLTSYAKPGQRILDTHLGSGSSAIAAHYFGVDFVGCELDEDYFNAAKARIDQETRQVAMF